MSAKSAKLHWQCHKIVTMFDGTNHKKMQCHKVSDTKSQVLRTVHNVQKLSRRTM
jgi:hypothetical protein